MAKLGATERNPMVPLALQAEPVRNGEFAAAPAAAQVLAEKHESRVRHTRARERVRAAGSFEVNEQKIEQYTIARH